METKVYYLFTDEPLSVEVWAQVAHIAYREQSGRPCFYASSIKVLPTEFYYRAGNVFVADQPFELLTSRSVMRSSFYDRVVVAYNIPIKNLMETIENARCIICVCPQKEDIEGWLVAHEAISIRTNKKLTCSEYPSVVVRKALDWLNSTSFPNSYMLHPFDEDRLMSVANALYALGEPLRMVAVMHYCLEMRWPEYTILRCLTAFQKAQEKRLKVQGSYTTESLSKIWNLKPEDMQKKSYIQSFFLNSMWGYKSVCWEHINEDVNILVGINGVGKTTLLDAIYSYFTGAKMQGKARVEKAQPAANMALPIAYVRTPDSPAPDKRVRESRLTQELTSVIMQNKEGNSFYNYLMRQVYESNENVQIIKKNVDELFQCINLFFKETGKSVFVDKDNNSVLSFHIEGREETIVHTQLSSGEKQLLLILIRVFLQEKSPAILLMDEPEISLHIRWQQMLIDAIRQLNPHCQVILTTHSPSILSRGWGDRVVYMENLVR